MRQRRVRDALAPQWELFRQSGIGLLGLGIIALFGLMAVVHPVLMSVVWRPEVYDPLGGYDAELRRLVVVEEVRDPGREIARVTAQLSEGLEVEVGDTVTRAVQPAPPSRAHWLGTDQFGRDVLSQLMFSTRSVFAMAAVAATVSAAVATTVGAVAGYLGGVADSALMRFADLVLLVPLIPLLAVVGGLFTLDLVHLGIMIGLLSGFGSTAIVLKSQALTVKVQPFVDAAKVAGGGSAHIIFRHIVPNVLPLSLLYMMFTVTEAITVESVLSFFGLLDVPMSWGIMLYTTQATGHLFLGTRSWWLVVPPALSISALAAAFFFVGRALDQVLNPRLTAR